MTTDSLKDTVHYASLLDTARLIQSKELSPVDLTHWMLDRIAAVDGRLRSCATVTAERALAAAQDAEQEIVRGRYRGPLHGKSAGERCMWWPHSVGFFKFTSRPRFS